MRWLGFLAILAAVAGHAASQDIVTEIISQVSSFFQTYEEAPYEVTRTFSNGFEERSYPAQKWVCTEDDALMTEDVSERHFWRLFQYITGNNAGNEKYEMTVPVSNQVTPTASGDMAKYRMCFYIGHEHQANPSNPNEAAVFMEERPAMTIFTRTLGGYLTGEENSRWMAEAENVKGFLGTMGEGYDTHTMWWVGYDAPWKFWNRRNEVWIKKN